jgi:hypothetical protein
MKTLLGRCLAAAFMLVTARASSQCSWQEVRSDPPGPCQGASMTYDAARDRCTMFSQWGSVFEWDGGRWRLNDPVNRFDPGAQPPSSGAMAYDAAHSQSVLMTGGSGPGSGQTWLFTGSRWMRSPGGGPPARVSTAMVYDSARARVILFGGGDPDYYGARWADTWEWDGTVWTQRLGRGPSARASHSMAYDSVRHRVVLFGGVAANGQRLADTWEWDGVAWAQRLPAAGPPARHGAFMAFDSARARTVLFGGSSADGPDLADTWEWNGTGWSSIAATGPSTRHAGAMVFDIVRARIILYGGSHDSSALSPSVDTWQWDGAAWVQLSPPNPTWRYFHGLAFDSDLHRVVLFGGEVVFNDTGSLSGETWFWNGAAWNRGPSGPSARDEFDMVYDQARHQVVLFGGNSNATQLQDTWVLSNGTVWTLRAGAGPSARIMHAMAYDSRRQRVVLFGGQTSNQNPVTYFGDTWEWDGASWTQASPQGQSPPARGRHLMTYDAHRRRVVLVGGSTNAGSFYDTWEWDGTTWEQRAPFPAVAAAMTFDPLTQTSVAFGITLSQDDSSMWDYDGTAWTPRPNNVDHARYGAPVVFDADRSRFVRFGGRGGATVHGDTLELPPGNQPISLTTQPADQAIHNGETVVFTAGAAGAGPLTYQWWHTDQHGVVDGPGGAAGGQLGGFVSGATTPTLTITRATPADMYEGGTYFCTISNACTSVSTRAAILTVTSCGTADFDHDGSPGTDADIESFFACLAGNCCPTCGSPDFNADGDYATDNDIEAFFRVLAGGTC